MGTLSCVRRTERTVATSESISSSFPSRLWSSETCSRFPNLHHHWYLRTTSTTRPERWISSCDPTTDVVVIQDLTTLSEALVIADKYNIGVARSRLRPLFMEFAVTEPLRAYAIACRLGLEDEKTLGTNSYLLIRYMSSKLQTNGKKTSPVITLQMLGFFRIY